jgi:26S proteasome regulatory subunit T6
MDILDAALLRPGRIDRKIEFPNPNESSRLDILKIHSRKMNLVRGIDLKSIADKMTGASGAELKVRLLLPVSTPVIASDWFSHCI